MSFSHEPTGVESSRDLGAGEFAAAPAGGGGSPPGGEPPDASFPPPDFTRGPFAVWREGDDGFHVEFSLPAFSFGQETVDGVVRHHIDAGGGAGAIKRAGRPELPAYRTDFRVPPGMELQVEIEAVDREVVAYDSPMLSRGFVERRGEGKAPATPVREGGRFPGEWSRATVPYHIGSSRGVGLLVYPFQYLDEAGDLQIARQLSLRLTLVPVAGDAASRAPSGGVRYSDVERAARSRYINLSSESDGLSGESWERGEGVGGVLENSLLIVVPDAWVATVAPFAEWKRQRGFATVISRYPADTGTGATALKAHIAGQYAEVGTSHIILAGDSGDIPVAKASPHPSDTVYTLLEGDDIYHDAFISRLAVQTQADLHHQLNTFLTYEQNPDSGEAGDWYTQGLFVASNEGATKSAFKLNDRDILALERDRLLAAGYASIDQMYDPGASRSATIAAWNQGRSYVLYLGHGEYTSWRTTSFNVDDARGLNNGFALPMVVNGSCYNGNFTLSYESLGEAMMRGRGEGRGGGAIGVVAATTAADWDPPIVLLRAFNDLIVEDSPLGVGAFSFLAIQAAMDYCYNTPTEGSTAATKLMEQMHLLGDCTLGLRTRKPFVLHVSHPPVAVPENTFLVAVSRADGTGLQDVVVSLLGGDTFQVVALTDANGEAVLTIPPADGDGMVDELLLTVYTRNAAPFQAAVSAQPAQVTVYSPAALPAGYVDEAYSFTLQAAGGAPPYAWELGPDAPAWLDVHPATGVLSGLPEAPGEFAFTVVVGDQEGDVDTQLANLQIGWPVTLEKIPPSPGMVGEAYQATLVAEGSFPPFAFSLADGSPPPGVAFTASGEFVGTPEQAGDYELVVEVVDQTGRRDSFGTSLSVDPSPVILIAEPGTLPPGDFAQSYAFIFTASGGTGRGYVWQLAAGALPEGLSLSADGIVSGTPSEWGQFEFTVQVVDDHQPPHQGEKPFTLRVERPVRFVDLSLPVGAPGLPYAGQLIAEGSHTPFLFQQLPASDDYTVDEAPASLVWEQTSPPTWIGDESEWAFELPFAFPFHDHLYTECRVGDNGYLILAGSSPSPMWDATVDEFQGLVMIAPLWNDQYMGTQFPETGIWLETSEDFVRIRWAGRDYHSQDDTMQFATTLHRDGRITFHYGGIQTTNRTVIGIVAGPGTAQILASHSYTPSDPVYLAGWDHHPDVVFTPPLTTVDWLQVAVDGTLSGVPPLSGLYHLAAKVLDSQGYQDTKVFPLLVADLHPADTSGDGDVDNAELLAFIEEIAAGRFPEGELATAIELWRNPPATSGPRGGEPVGGSGLVARRQLPAPGYIPGRAAVFRYTLGWSLGIAPKAMIFGEHGDDLQAIEAFEIVAGEAFTPLPMRRDATGVFWLVHDAPLDDMHIHARFSTPLVSRGDLPVRATVETIYGSDWMTGVDLWPVADNEQITRHFKPGWNLFSVPLKLVDPEVSAALSGLAFTPPVWQWNGEAFEPAEKIKPGEAYWVRCPTESPITFVGSRETDILRSAPVGWLLTGAFGPLKVDSAAGIDMAWLWDAESQFFRQQEILDEDVPGWLLLPRECLLDLRY